MTYLNASPLSLDPRTLQLGGPMGRIDVTAPEYSLLKALAESPESRLATPDLLDVAGKEQTSLGKRALEVQIVRLRKKMEQAGAAPPTIKALRGMGYLLCVPIQIADPASPQV